ncbi:conserved hypothetical protein [Theileria orientalis strain Shintoku]|uniref:Uncharacterized protein n=1 Tax=Theileria orientalis strain Shintoku TaxID=869250 RepID=J7MER3_THEOR|nr:conserved hypothetical protein [Theileria orientalis strain Shintoku]BAM38679.1 conserved hypothetical protein [Theileria orientalis strain Shintoku]|eukprot:XP_009688980.1 conserved hypothetical protein [Theileria orientalis strain Shintoku]
MKFGENRDYIRITTVLNALDVNRKLFCNYLKEYANKKSQCLYVDSLLSYLDELLMESIADLRKIEAPASARSNSRSLDNPDLRDQYLNWKNDLVLRIIVTKNLVLFSSCLFLLLEKTGHS